MLAWANQWPTRKWAIENADGLGHHLALWLLAFGELVVDIPPSATARVRQLSKGGRRKNDRIDAAAAACVAALQGDARPVHPETHSDSESLLSERRNSLSGRRTQTVNQLHALLRELVPGGAPVDLSVPKAAAVLRSIRPLTATDRVRKELAKDLVADIKRYDTQLAENSRQMDLVLDEHGTTLRDTRNRTSPRRENPRRHGSCEPISLSGCLRELHRHGACGSRQRGLLTPSPVALWEPLTQLGAAYCSRGADPHAPQRRPHVLRQENRRRKIAP